MADILDDLKTEHAFQVACGGRDTFGGICLRRAAAEIERLRKLVRLERLERNQGERSSPWQWDMETEAMLREPSQGA